MNNPIIVGTLALDTVETPFGRKEGVLGGSACYAALAASFFSHPGIVAVAGNDFPEEHLKLLSDKNINLDGLERTGKTFRWEGSYEYDMNEAHTKKTELNALSDFKARLPDSYRLATHIFLANIDPELQMKVVEQLENPEVIMLDTMNFWIENKKDKLLEVMKKANIIVMNDGEARMLHDTASLMKSAHETLKLGPEAVIIKKGEHGSLLFTKGKHFNAPGYPLEALKDPTGCGDSFGGGLIGHLAKKGVMDDRALRKGIVLGSAIASYNAEDFSVGRLTSITLADIEKRFGEMREMREF
ncbi:MAG: sugar kinase [Nanoarchaeota archaeon]|nr:sugar kinase [Nanoarchaeota archaeon]